jgi:hypothetical protein
MNACMVAVLMQLIDLANIAFGSLALPGKELELHKVGKLAVLFKR